MHSPDGGRRGRESLSRRGEHDEALALLDEAVALVEPIDFLELKGVVHDVSPRRSRASAASTTRSRAVERAIGFHEQKGNVVSAARSRAVLDDLRAGATLVDSARGGMPELRARERRTTRGSAGVCGPRSPSASLRASSARSSRFSSATSSARPHSASRPIPRRCARACAATSRICASSSSGTAVRSRSSSATRSWPSSGSRSRTRTMRFAPFAPRRRCRRRSPSTGSRRASASTRARSSSAARAETLVTGDAVNVAARLEQAAGAARCSSAPRRGRSSAMPSASRRSSRLRSRGSPSRSRRSGCSRSSAMRRRSHATRDAPRRTRARAAAALARLRGRGRRQHVPALHAARPGRDRQVAPRRRLPRAGRRLGRRPARTLPLVRRGNHVLAARRDPDRDRRRARLRDRHVASGDAARLPPAARSAGRERAAGRRHRRPAVGGAGLHRPRRARRGLLARRTDLPPLRRAHRASRLAARLGRREDERVVAPARASGADECAELMDSLVADAASTRSCESASRPPPRATRSTSKRCSRWCASTAATARSSCRRRSTRSCRHASTRSTETSASSWSEARSRARSSIVAPSPSSRPDPVRSAVESHLATLVRKELIRSTAPTFPEDEGFRFRHLLIRDAAYESLPKATRAELHERFADWLADARPGRAATRSSATTSSRRTAIARSSTPADPALPRLAARVSDRLAAAGRGAMDRGDFNAGRSLFRRAAAILAEDDPERLALAPDLAHGTVGVRGSRRVP